MRCLRGVGALAVALLVAGSAWAGDGGAVAFNSRDKFYDIVEWDGGLFVAGYPGFLLKTADRAQTLEPQKTDTDRALFSMSAFDEKIALASGPGGLMLRTEDGGKSWSKTETGVQIPLFSVFALKGTAKAWAVGLFNTILHSADQGKSWARQEHQLPEDTDDEPTLNAVWFIDENNGVAVGEFGVIIATKDGGKTWTDRRSPAPDALYDMAFTDALRGVAVGSKGTIAFTADGGATWRAVRLDTDRHFFGLHVLGDMLYVVGQDGYFISLSLKDKLFSFPFPAPAQAAPGLEGGEEGEAAPPEPPLLALKPWRTGVYTWLAAVRFLSPEEGLAAGGRGRILKTTDGGKTWTKLTGR
ncbi:MAG: hypothetical protein C4523_17365 [Myxococcales bacterium]|nr:MAG: hypothetical protein C4523_17365 [Myxococcales bacterium]